MVRETFRYASLAWLDRCAELVDIALTGLADFLQFRFDGLRVALKLSLATRSEISGMRFQAVDDSMLAWGYVSAEFVDFCGARVVHSPRRRWQKQSGKDKCAAENVLHVVP